MGYYLPLHLSPSPAVSSTVNLKTSEGKSTLRLNNLTNLSVEKVPIYLTFLSMGLKKLGLGKQNEEFSSWFDV